MKPLLFDTLTKRRSEINDDDVYDDADIRAHADEVIALGKNGILAVCDDGDAVSFAVFDFVSGPATENGVEVEGVSYRCIFHGNGFSGALRECRHTQWGEPDNRGYMFYPPGRIIIEAVQTLERWFDMGWR